MRGRLVPDDLGLAAPSHEEGAPCRLAPDNAALRPRAYSGSIPAAMFGPSSALVMPGRVTAEAPHTPSKDPFLLRDYAPAAQVDDAEGASDLPDWMEWILVDAEVCKPGASTLLKGT